MGLRGGVEFAVVVVGIAAVQEPAIAVAHRDPDGEVVLVHIRLAIVAPGPRLEPAAAPAGHLEESIRGVRFGGEWVETTVLRGEPAAGTSAYGPVLFELPEATFVLPPGWSAQVDAAGTIKAELAR